MNKDTNPRKRVRVSVACQNCRNRKLRCDGNQPNCKRCEEIGTACTYEQPIADVGVTSSSQLLARMAALERKLESSQGRPSAEAEMSTRDHDSGFSEASGVLHNQRSPNVKSSMFSSINMSVHNDTVDGMGTVQLTEGVDSPSFFANSSNLALLRQISGALIHARDLEPFRRSNALPHDLSEAWTPTVASPRAGSQSFVHGEARPSVFQLPYCSEYALPPETELLKLLDEYFGTTGLFFPCIHQDTFLARYREYANIKFESTSKTWLALLYMMVANVNQTKSYASPSEKAAEMADFYYRKALDLVRSDLLFQSSTEIVQVLCLMTCYLQGSSSSSQAWTFHSLSIKAATQIGLQTMSVSKDASPLEREMRKRTWFWCLINDSVLCVKLGRPPAAPKSAVMMESPVDIEDKLPTLNRPGTVAADSLAYYNATISLSDLTLDIVSQLYGGNMDLQDNLSAGDTLRTAFNLSLKLHEMLPAIPEALRPRRLSEEVLIKPVSLQCRRFHAVLTLRFHGACALVYRSVLFCFFDAQKSGIGAAADIATLREFGVTFLEKCASDCSDMIAISNNIIRHSRSQKVLISGAWWYTAFYAFNGALMLLGLLLLSNGRTFSDLFTPERCEQMRCSLEDAVGVLSSLNNNNVVITRCHEVLKRCLASYRVTQAAEAEQSFARSEVDISQQLLDDAAFIAQGDFDIDSLSGFHQIGNDFTWLDTAWFPEPRACGATSLDFQDMYDP